MTNPAWINRGKTVAQLIEELRTFGNQEIEVRISVDGGETSLPISLVAKCDGQFALLQNSQDVPTPMRHRK
jgi:hypothetical protein